MAVLARIFISRWTEKVKEKYCSWKYGIPSKYVSTIYYGISLHETLSFVPFLTLRDDTSVGLSGCWDHSIVENQNYRTYDKIFGLGWWVEYAANWLMCTLDLILVVILVLLTITRSLNLSNKNIWRKGASNFDLSHRYFVLQRISRQGRGQCPLAAELNLIIKMKIRFGDQSKSSRPWCYGLNWPDSSPYRNRYVCLLPIWLR